MSSSEARLRAERDAITARVVALQRQFDEIVETSSWTTNDDEHDPEGQTIGYERAQVSGMLRQARADLEELDAAERRLEDGSYGRCDRCGQPIAQQRLEALPLARTCITCASRRRRG